MPFRMWFINSLLGRIFVGPDSQTWMHAISSVKVDETDNSYVETTYGVTRMCSSKLHTSVFKAFVSVNYCTFVLKQRVFQHIDVFMSLIGCLNPEHFMKLCCWLGTLQSILCWCSGSEDPDCNSVCCWTAGKCIFWFFSKTYNEKPIWSKITWIFFFLHGGSSTCWNQLKVQLKFSLV